MAISTFAAKAAWASIRTNIPELPEAHHLEPRHIAHLEKDGIDAQAAMIAGVFSADVELAKQLTGHAMAGLVFTYFTPDGKDIYRYGDDQKPFFRLRPDNPINKKNKYLSPKGAGSFIYYPRVVGESFEDINNAELLLTEGEKKSLKSTLAGLPCIGIGGVTSYRTGPKDDTGKRALGSLIEDINLFSLARLTVVFDSDITHKWQVANAIKSLTYDLLEAYQQQEQEEAGSNNAIPHQTIKLAKKLRFILLPNRLALATNPADNEAGKLGLDDALVLFGVADIKALLDSSFPLAHAEWKGAEEGLKVECLFMPEPCGDGVSKKVPVENQRHYRSLLYWLAAKHRYMQVSELGYMCYSEHEGIWKLISKDEWNNLGEYVADAQNWKNRRVDLMHQHERTIKKRLCAHKRDLNPVQYVGFTNGILNTETMELLPFSPTHLLTQRLNFAYDPEATCNTWLRWIDWVFNGDEVKIDLVQALFRWTLEPKDDGPHLAQICPIAIGESGHGKGTFLEVLKNLLGKDSYGKWTYQTLSDSNSLLGLLHKRGAISEELKGELNAKMVATFNNIVSNEQVETYSKYHDKTSQPLRTVMWGAMNHPIRSRVADKVGLNRRIIYIKFDRKPETVDPKLSRKLAADNSGIFNWVWSLDINTAVERINVYLESEENVRTQTEYLEDSNTVYEWMKSLYLEVEMTALLSEWYKKYRDWCHEAGYTHMLGRTNWSRQMVLAGAVKKKRIGTGIPMTVPALKNVDARRLLGLPGKKGASAKVASEEEDGDS